MHSVSSSRWFSFDEKKKTQFGTGEFNRFRVVILFHSPFRSLSLRRKVRARACACSVCVYVRSSIGEWKRKMSTERAGDDGSATRRQHRDAKAVWPPAECRDLSESYKRCFMKLSWSWTDDSEEREKCDDIFEELQTCLKKATGQLSSKSNEDSQ